MSNVCPAVDGLCVSLSDDILRCVQCGEPVDIWDTEDHYVKANEESK